MNSGRRAAVDDPEEIARLKSENKATKSRKGSADSGRSGVELDWDRDVGSPVSPAGRATDVTNPLVVATQEAIRSPHEVRAGLSILRCIGWVVLPPRGALCR